MTLDQTTPAPAGWLTSHDFPCPVRAVEAAGHVVGYVDEGEGQTYLLLQGGQWSLVYRDVIPRFAQRGRVVAVDFPGAGLSPEPATEPQLEELPDVLEAFVDELGLTDIVLVMHDISGIVGSAVVARRPELVAGIVYANTFGWAPDTASLRAMLRIVSSSPLRGLAWLTNWMLGVSASRGGAGRNWDRDMKRLFRAAGSPRSRRTRSLRLMGQTLRPSPLFEEIEAARHRTRAIPALTIFGEKNDPFGFAARHASHHNDIEAVVVDGGNHFPMADAPDVFVESIVRWRARHADASTR